MRYLLDTNICIYIIRQQPPQVLAHFQDLDPSDVGISAITIAELEYGIVKSQQQERNHNALRQFLLTLEMVDFDAQAAAIYGTIRSGLERQGLPIGAMDLLIAAHAMSLDVTLVTNNSREFERVSGLRLENWAS